MYSVTTHNLQFRVSLQTFPSILFTRDPLVRPLKFYLIPNGWPTRSAESHGKKVLIIEF